MFVTSHSTDSEVLFRDAFGFRRSARLTDEMQARLFTGATALPPESAAMLRHGSTAIDVGANIGALTAHLCRAVGPSGSVLAIEPIPSNAARLTQLLTMNRTTNLQIAQVAVADKPGRATISLGDPGNSGHASFDASWITHGQLDVEIETIDRLVDRYLAGRRVTFIKIDVEGHEPKVLQGAVRVLTDHKPAVQCEFNDPILRDIGTEASALLSHFAEFDYVPVRDYGPLDGRVTDVLLVPRGAGSPP